MPTHPTHPTHPTSRRVAATRVGSLNVAAVTVPATGHGASEIAPRRDHHCSHPRRTGAAIGEGDAGTVQTPLRTFEKKGRQFKRVVAFLARNTKTPDAHANACRTLPTLISKRTRILRERS